MEFEATWGETGLSISEGQREIHARRDLPVHCAPRPDTRVTAVEEVTDKMPQTRWTT